MKEPVANHAIKLPHRTKSWKAIVGYQLLNVQLAQRSGLMIQLAKQKRSAQIGRKQAAP